MEPPYGKRSICPLCSKPCPLPSFVDSGCYTETVPSSGSGYGFGSLNNCSGNTQSTIEGTFGFWLRLYHGPKGRLQLGPQYSYLVRNAWPGSISCRSVCGTLAARTLSFSNGGEGFFSDREGLYRSVRQLLASERLPVGIEWATRYQSCREQLRTLGPTEIFAIKNLSCISPHTAHPAFVLGQKQR